MQVHIARWQGLVLLITASLAVVHDYLNLVVPPTLPTHAIWVLTLQLCAPDASTHTDHKNRCGKVLDCSHFWNIFDGLLSEKYHKTIHCFRMALLEPGISQGEKRVKWTTGILTGIMIIHKYVLISSCSLPLLSIFIIFNKWTIIHFILWDHSVRSLRYQFHTSLFEKVISFQKHKHTHLVTHREIVVHLHVPYLPYIIYIIYHTFTFHQPFANNRLYDHGDPVSINNGP